MIWSDFHKIYYEIGDAVDMLRYHTAKKWLIVMHPDTLEGLRKVKARFLTSLYGLDVVEDTRYELGEFVFRPKSVD